MNLKNSSRKLEICCYSVFSCLAAVRGGADRIELCAGMPEGGVTPSYGLLKHALEQVNLPIYVMIRARGGDFCFNDWERSVMKEDIQMLKSLNPAGFVIGALKPNGQLDTDVIEEQLQLIGSTPVTFHRAFDMCKNPNEAIDILVDYGIENILTSGQYQNAIEGIKNLESFVETAAGRINIMAGSGVNPGNILALAETGVHAFHFSAKKRFSSLMEFRNEKINMGGDKSVDEFANYEADYLLVQEAKKIIETI